MITIRNTELKNELTEFTVLEFEKIMVLQNDKDIEVIDLLLETIIIAGMKDETVLSELTFVELQEFEKSLKIGTKETVKEYTFTKEIEINGNIYRSFEGEGFTPLAKDMALIEKAIKKNNIKYIVETMAILFKDIRLTKNEHYDNNHIKYKMDLFKDLPAIIVLPFIMFIVENILNKINNNETNDLKNEILEDYEKLTGK